MLSLPRLRASRFVLAIVVAVVLVLSAPFIGYLRSWIRTRFPGQFAAIVGGLVAATGIAAIGAAVVRIREHRAIRYAAIAAALGCAVWYSLTRTTGNPEADVVTRFHFIEYGLITFLFYRAWRPLGDPAIVMLPAMAALIVGAADEWLQWFIPNRVGELADIFLNGVAIVCGLAFSVGADPPPAFSMRLGPGSRLWIGRLAAAFVIALAAFFHTVHIGHDVTDENGMFKSRYARVTLEEMRAAKAEEWRVRPLPVVLRRVSREDQYMTEGVTHVQERNRQWAAGNVYAARQENRILEKYYGPVLDTPSYVSRTGHRWPDAQRADAESRPTAAPDSYVSAANPYPIYNWSPLVLWLVALVTACAVLAVTFPRAGTGP